LPPDAGLSDQRGKSKSEGVMQGDFQTIVTSFLQHPNDIMIIGFALLFFGVCQLFRKASS
jgi:hypothetical protein